MEATRVYAEQDAACPSPGVGPEGSLLGAAFFQALFPEEPAPAAAPSPAAAAAAAAAPLACFSDSEVEAYLYGQLFDAPPAQPAAAAAAPARPAVRSAEQQQGSAAAPAAAPRTSVAGAPRNPASASTNRRATVAGGVGAGWAKPAPAAAAPASRRASVAGAGSPAAAGRRASAAGAAPGTVPSYLRATASTLDKAKSPPTSRPASFTAPSRPTTSRLALPEPAAATPSSPPAAPPVMGEEMSDMEEYRHKLLEELPVEDCVAKSTGSATKPRPFKLSTDVRAEWEERLKPGHAKLSTEDLRALQAEQEAEQLRARLAASSANFHRAQAAAANMDLAAKTAPPQVTEPEPFQLISAERHESYAHAWALKQQQCEKLSDEHRVFKAQEFDAGIKAGEYAHFTPQLAWVTEARAPAFLIEHRAEKRALADSERRAQEEAAAKEAEVERRAKLTPEQLELEELHAKHLFKARELPAFYKSPSNTKARPGGARSSPGSATSKGAGGEGDTAQAPLAGPRSAEKELETSSVGAVAASLSACEQAPGAVEEAPVAPIEAIPEDEQEQAAAAESGLQNEAATALALEVPTAEPAAAEVAKVPGAEAEAALDLQASEAAIRHISIEATTPPAAAAKEVAAVSNSRAGGRMAQVLAAVRGVFAACFGSKA